MFASLVVAAAAPARADGEDPSAAVSARNQHPFSINLSVGVGTEFGILTLARSWRLTDQLSVDTGIGLGLAGVKARVFPKIEMHLSKHGWLTLGAGVNIGQHSWAEQGGWCFDDSCAQKRATVGVSATTAATLEYRGSSAWRFGPYVGAEVLLNSSAMSCIGGEESTTHCESDHADDGLHRIFTGLRFTRTF